VPLHNQIPVSLEVHNVFGWVGPEAPITATAPTPVHSTQEWAITNKVDLDDHLLHKSDNPYDFLQAAKLDKLIRFWNNTAEPAFSRTTRSAFSVNPR
jgi:hypothetical protein